MYHLCMTTATIRSNAALVAQGEMADRALASLLLRSQLLVIQSDAPRLLILCRPIPIRSAFGHGFEGGSMTPLVVWVAGVVVLLHYELGRLRVPLSVYTVAILVATDGLVKGLWHLHI